MTPTNQTKFSAFTSKGERITYGNCLVACIASVLDVDIHEVPNLYTLYGITRPQPPDAVDTPYWAEVLNTWMREKHGKELEIMTDIAYASRVTKDPNYPRTAIVKGMSHRDKPHCCIYHLSTLIWDPHPSREGLKETKHVYVITPVKNIDPRITKEWLSKHKYVEYEGIDKEMMKTRGENDATVEQPLSTQIQVALSNGSITGSEAIAISASGMSVEEFLKGKHNSITGDVKKVDDKSLHTPIIINKSFTVSNGSEIECTTYKTTDAVIDPLQAIEERKKALAGLHEEEELPEKRFIKCVKVVIDGVEETVFVGDTVITKGYTEDYDGKELTITRIFALEYCHFIPHTESHHNFHRSDIVKIVRRKGE